MNLDELAKRLVKCKHFRWMDGMLAISFEGGCRWHTRQHEQNDNIPESDNIPDLTDPATLGCLLHLAREAWCDHRAAVTYCDEGWRFEVWNSDNFFPDWPLGKCFPTEAEALVEAAEAAS